MTPWIFGSLAAPSGVSDSRLLLSLIVVAGVSVLYVWAYRRAAAQDEADSLAALNRRAVEWTEADELREDDALYAAIAEWKASLVPMTDEQRERSRRYIASRLPQYPRSTGARLS